MQEVDAGYVTLPAGACPASITTASECFEAATKTWGNVTTREGSLGSQPRGCSATARQVGGWVGVGVFPPAWSSR